MMGNVKSRQAKWRRQASIIDQATCSNIYRQEQHGSFFVAYASCISRVAIEILVTRMIISFSFPSRYVKRNAQN